MKKYLLIMILLMAGALFAQDYSFTLTVQNQQVDGTNFSFDIYMLRTGTDDIYLGDCDFVLTFNSGNFSSPGVSVTGAATRLSTFYSLSPTIVSTNRMVLNVQKPGFGNQTDFDNRVQVIGTTGNGTLIASIQLTNISNAAGTAGLAWRTSSPNQTIVNRFDTTDPWAQHNIDGFGTYTDPSDASLPVQLSAFAAESVNDGVLLTWSTQSEHDNLGFILERKLDNDAEWASIASYVTHEALKGKVNSTSPQDYEFTDADVKNGQVVRYRLSDVDINGHKNVGDELSVTVTAMVPKAMALLQPYPNPFNPVTTVRYDLSKDARVSIKVYNLVGQQVAELYNGNQLAGEQSLTWNAANMPSGVYIVRMQTAGFTKVQKCMLIK